MPSLALCYVGISSQSTDALPGSQQPLATVDTLAGSDRTSDVPSVIWLYATLHFSPRDTAAASRFEIHCNIDADSIAGSSRVAEPSSADNIASTSTVTDSPNAREAAKQPRWVWLGTAAVAQFRVTRLEVPVNAVSVQFVVQAADATGKLVPFASAATATVSRP